MTCEQLKAHPVCPYPNVWGLANKQFFYGVDWASIRDIDAPFVPHLRSITDTSYFPTDEIDQTSDLPVGADAGDDAKKDLAFLGYTYVMLLCLWTTRLVMRCPMLMYRFRRYEML
jgi:protein-serine/threonine kinase